MNKIGRLHIWGELECDDVMMAEVVALGDSVRTAGAGARVIAVLGAREARDVVRLSIGVELPPGERPLTPLAQTGTLILSVGALDSRARAAAARAEGALRGAVGAAAAVLLVVRLPDVARPSASGIERVAACLRNSTTAGADANNNANANATTGARRRRVVVAVTGYESEECTEQDVVEAVTSCFDSCLQDNGSGIEATEAAAGGLDDVMDLHVLCLPHRGENVAKHTGKNEEIGSLLTPLELAPFASTESIDVMIQSIEGAMKEVTINSGFNSGTEREQAASYVCTSRGVVALDKYRAISRGWRGTVDGGRIVASFGKEVDTTINETLSGFDTDCAAYIDTRAHERVRTRLRGTMLDEAYVLYVRQVGKVRELSYQIFRTKLARVRITSTVERSVRSVVHEAEKYFYDKTLALRPSGGVADWRCDAARAELGRTMREDAKQRLQIARLNGNYVPSIRAPLMLAFHTLLAAPFGKDSRVAGMQQPEEMQTKFDPDKAKKADLLRSRPYPTKHIVKLGWGEALRTDALDDIDQFFAPQK